MCQLSWFIQHDKLLSRAMHHYWKDSNNQNLAVIARVVQSSPDVARASLRGKGVFFFLWINNLDSVERSPSKSQRVCLPYIPLDQHHSGTRHCSSHHLGHHPLLLLGHNLSHQLCLPISEEHAGKGWGDLTLSKNKNSLLLADLTCTLLSAFLHSIANTNIDVTSS